MKNGAQEYNEKVLTWISKYCQEHKKISSGWTLFVKWSSSKKVFEFFFFEN